MLEAAPKVLTEPPTIDEMGAKPAHPVATPAIDAALAVVSAAPGPAGGMIERFGETIASTTTAPPKNGLMFLLPETEALPDDVSPMNRI
jgi:hypothetical protein